MRKFIEKSSFLAIALTLSISAMTACGSIAEKSANEKPAGGTAHNASPVNDKKPAENKAVENKTENPQSGLIEIYDGRETNRKQTEATKADEELVTEEFKAKESNIKQKFGDRYCDESESSSVGLTGAVEGSFTKPNSKQKAFTYELCSSGSSHFGVGGIMIFEDGKIVSHYAYGENGLMSGRISTLPDINKNGLTELVLTDGQTHQGYSSEFIDILEFKDGNLATLGGKTIATDNSGAAEDDSKIEAEAFKISVQPSANPIFFQEIYQKKGNAKNWSLTKKSEKVSLDKDNFGKNYKIS